MSIDGTQQFTPIICRSDEVRGIVLAVYEALVQKGYNPINQLVGYILSEDPSYITNYQNARTLITTVDRDELLRELVIHYLGSGGKAG